MNIPIDKQKTERYPMCADQSAQIDCRVTACIYHHHGSCTNVSPAITLSPDRIFTCWSMKNIYNVNLKEKDDLFS